MNLRSDLDKMKAAGGPAAFGSPGEWTAGAYLAAMVIVAPRLAN